MAKKLTERKPHAPKTEQQVEIAAITSISRTLNKLNVAARRRVLAYLSSMQVQEVVMFKSSGGDIAVPLSEEAVSILKA